MKFIQMHSTRLIRPNYYFQVNEKVREKMFNLRMTWNEVFPQTKLYALDVKVNVMDNNWPITAKIVPKSVHVNPNFLKNQATEHQAQARAKEDLVNQMQAKERELLELKQRKIELELMVTKKKIGELAVSFLSLRLINQMYLQFMFISESTSTFSSICSHAVISFAFSCGELGQ